MPLANLTEVKASSTPQKPKKVFKTITPTKQTFMARFERFEPEARDSTAIVAAKKCKRYYFYKIVLGFRDKDSPQYFTFGGAYHKFREILEKSHQEDTSQALKDPGVLFVKAIDAATKEFRARGGDPTLNTKWDHLTEAKLIECCVLAFDDWRREKQRGNVEVLGVEQSFEVILSDGHSRRGGKADQFTKYSGQLAGRDFKTTSKDVKNNPNTENYYKRGLDPNDQFTGYMLGLTKLSGQFVGMLVVDLLVIPRPTKKQPNPKPYLTQYLSTRTHWQLEQWEKESILVEKLIDTCREEDIWPMEESACSFCEYHSVCTQGTEQAQMSQLEKYFTQIPWDYKNLGDEA